MESELDGEPEEPRELRQGYHDRIAELREQSLAVLEAVVASAARATGFLLGRESPNPAPFTTELVEMTELVSTIDTEVVTLLALEAPVARDLRVVLAARDVSQIGLLCVGLSSTIGTRSTLAGTIASTGLAETMERVGQVTLDLLEEGRAAWSALDEDMAWSTLERVDGARQTRRHFFAELLKLNDVPIEAAMELGLAARVYDRLIDHAAELAGRVVFVVSGRTAVVGPGE
ncbi:MAG: phosphate uptake regulator PhoU [Acidimicrobiales bacterium]|nr:phosphate uptake regulator PhoU [Acidimicrobiales bacterium]